MALAPGPGTAFAAGLSEVGDDAISAYVREHGCALVGTGAHLPLIQRGALFSRVMVNSETMLVRSVDLPAARLPRWPDQVEFLIETKETSL